MSGLARFLSERGECVLEVERPARTGRKSRLKSDSLDLIMLKRATGRDQDLIDVEALRLAEGRDQ